MDSLQIDKFICSLLLVIDLGLVYAGGRFE